MYIGVIFKNKKKQKQLCWWVWSFC